VLLPGVTTLARLVTSVREAANQRLWDSLHGLRSTGQRAVLDSLLTVPAGARVSELDSTPTSWSPSSEHPPGNQTHNTCEEEDNLDESHCGNRPGRGNGRDDADGAA
jgi:hypothetical protein